MTTNDRLIAYHLARLEDKNPEIRLRSIAELVQLEATEALPALETLYFNDPDAQVRREAKRAGRALFLLATQHPSEL
ncbi:MAG: HEAT repeat domain-containing protein [Anaerolineae bacterium]|nr:HEAT repeat domain-containing protein [Anaerolineae bacterium]MEB2287591.1 HEAT repeat domain-containing protein [Anaerolineae bacterium]